VTRYTHGTTARVRRAAVVLGWGGAATDGAHQVGVAVTLCASSSLDASTRGHIIERNWSASAAVRSGGGDPWTPRRFLAGLRDGHGWVGDSSTNGPRAKLRPSLLAWHPGVRLKQAFQRFLHHVHGLQGFERPRMNWRGRRDSAGRPPARVHPCAGVYSVYGQARGGMHAATRRPWADRGVLRLLVGPSGVASRIIPAGCLLAMLACGPLALVFQSLAHASAGKRGPPASRAASRGAVRATEIVLVDLPPPPPVVVAAAPAAASSLVTTVASWYPGRPEACYQQGRRMTYLRGSSSGRPPRRFPAVPGLK